MRSRYAHDFSTICTILKRDGMGWAFSMVVWALSWENIPLVLLFGLRVDLGR